MCVYWDAPTTAHRGCARKTVRSSSLKLEVSPAHETKEEGKGEEEKGDREKRRMNTLNWFWGWGALALARLKSSIVRYLLRCV